MPQPVSSNLPRTMQEIADALGLDRATVSVIANGNPQGRKFAGQTVERVQSYLREIGYVAPKGVQQLRGELPRRLGILHSGRLYSHLIEAFNALVESQADDPHGAEVAIRPDRDAVLGLREMVARGLNRPVWIVPGRISLNEEDRQDILALGRRLKPVIYNYRFGIDDESEMLLKNGFSLVGVLRSEAYGRMAAFLRQLGHSRVFLGDAYGQCAASAEQQLFLDQFGAAGLQFIVAKEPPPAKLSLPQRGEFIIETHRKLIRSAKPTAVVFRDDQVAVGAIDALLRAGLRVPEDVTAIGMDGHPLAPYFRVPLTTMAVPVEKMVRQTLKLCQQDQDAAEPSQHRFKYLLQEGSSHGPRLEKQEITES